MTLKVSGLVRIAQLVKQAPSTILRELHRNATKKAWFYGFKGHSQVTNAGILVAYAITKVSIHDVKLVKILVNQYFNAKILVDSG